MKNIQVIDGAENCVYDIFAVTEEDFTLIFPATQDIAFIDEVFTRSESSQLTEAVARLWDRRVPKTEVSGIHGTLFYQLEHKKVYYPDRRDEGAKNPDGTSIR